jgi:hypothetical protein
MKRIYHVVVVTTANEDYESTVETRYELETAADKASNSRPDVLIQIGDLYVRAGDIKTMRIDREMEVEQ